MTAAPIASWLNGRVTVELSPRGFDVMIRPPRVLPSRVATFASRHKAIAHGQALAGGCAQDGTTHAT